MDAKPLYSKALDLPKELWLLVDHLHKHGLKQVAVLCNTEEVMLTKLDKLN